MWFEPSSASPPEKVPIEHPDGPADPNQKESYNLYWAACNDTFEKVSKAVYYATCAKVPARKIGYRSACGTFTISSYGFTNLS